MIRHYRHITQRPDVFRLNPDAELAQGLVFAGLAPGGLVGSTHYHDSSLYGNHGTLTNMAPATDWIFDPTIGRWTLDFNGSDDYVTCGDATILDGATSCTFSAWVNQHTQGVQKICNKLGAAGNRSWQFCYDDVTNGEFQIDIWDNTARVLNRSSNASMAANAWYHVCGVWFGGTTASLYCNGRLLSEGTPTISGTPAAITNSSVAMVLGTTSAADGNWFDGQIADLLIHRRALSVSEIQQLADPSNTLLSGLILPPRRVLFPAAVAAGGIPEGYASLSAVADIAAVGYAERSGSAPLGAVASLTATGYHQSIAYATVSAIADLTAVGYTSHAGTANLSAIVGLSATGYATHSGEADLSAIADMVAVGEAPSIIPEGSATLSAIADMTAVGYASHAGEAALDAVADIAAVGYRESAGYAVLAAVADLVAVGSAPGEEGAGTGGKTADGLTWPDVDGLTWEEVDSLPWSMIGSIYGTWTPPARSRTWTPPARSRTWTPQSRGN